MQEEQNTTGLVWFHKNLRSQDNIALYSACKRHQKVIAVYFLDPRDFGLTNSGFKKTERFRTKFLLETLLDLQKSLKKLHITFIVTYDIPENALKELCQKYSIAKVYLQKEWTHEEDSIIKKVKNRIPETIDFCEFYDQFLYHPDDIEVTVNDIPQVFTQFRKHVEKKVSIREITTIHPKHPTNLLNEETEIPNLESFGFTTSKVHKNSAFPFKGGENEARKRIEYYFFQTKKLATYKKTRNGLVGVDYSSKLSAWLANGSISARQIYTYVKEFEQTYTKNDSTYWLIFELIWRDFFKYISLKYGNDIFKLKGILNKVYDWNTDRDLIQQWMHGKTDEPFVNANMLELNETGWMSNRGRQNVASYFAKTLGLDWRIGAAYFESMLIDYDVHSNYGNWMYVAGVGNDPRDRRFNVKLQAERYDTNQRYRDAWLTKKETIK